VDPEFESLRALRYLVKPFGLRELEEAIQGLAPTDGESVSQTLRSLEEAARVSMSRACG
jgi:DNA-binding response OmpR family regulator